MAKQLDRQEMEKILEARRAFVTLQDKLKQLQDSIGPAPAETACIRCEHFNSNGVCGYWVAMVPKQEQGKGCEKFISYIPF